MQQAGGFFGAIKAGWREPLVHFLLAGAAIFWGVSTLQPEDRSGREITVSSSDLLVLLQGRARVYDEQAFAELLAAMPAAERAELVRDAALQEALYREGLAAGMADADPLVRSRVIQQMRALVEEEALAGVTVTDEEVRAYFEANRARYAAPPTISFEHLFFRGEQGQAAALAARRQLAAGAAAGAGDRFAYQRSYADASADLLDGHFGAAFTRAVFAVEPGAWSQPIASEHGWHLVRASAVSAGAAADLAAIAPQVREDALAERRQELGAAALDRFLAGYRIVTEDGLEQ